MKRLIVVAMCLLILGCGDSNEKKEIYVLQDGDIAVVKYKFTADAEITKEPLETDFTIEDGVLFIKDDYGNNIAIDEDNMFIFNKDDVVLVDKTGVNYCRIRLLEDNSFYWVPLCLLSSWYRTF